MLFVDTAMARRLEAAEQIPSVQHAAALARLRPEVGVAVEAIGGGHAVYTGPGSASNHAVGLGLAGPVTAEELNRLEKFYFSRDVPAQVHVSPLADASLLDLLNERGYRVAEFNNVLARPLGPSESFPPPATGIEIRRAAAEDADLWANVVASGFLADMGPAADTEGMGDPARLEDALAASFHIPDHLAFLALCGGRPAGGAGGNLLVEQKLVALSGSSTLPEFRRRGVHTALLNARLALAAATGCDLAVTVTRPGSVSQRNMERLGFRVMYSKLTMALSYAT